MTVTREFGGIIGLVVAAVTGGGYLYSANGDRDFEIEVGRSPKDVYSAFSDIRRTGRGVRDYGFTVPPIEETHPSDHELVFTSESVNPGQPSRIAFTFAKGDKPVSTIVTVAVDAPPIRYGDKVLSEDKVEDLFREAVTELGKRLDNGNSPVAANAKLATLLDMVALTANPAEYERFQNRLKKLQGEVEAAKAGLERDGYRVEKSADGRGYDLYYDDESKPRP